MTDPSRTAGSGEISGTGSGLAAGTFLGTLTLALSWPMFRRLPDPTTAIYGINDFPFHLRQASRMRWWPPYPVEPNFGLHLAGRLVAWGTPLDLSGAMVLLVTIGSAATALGGWALLRNPTLTRARLGPWFACALALCFWVMESPAILAYGTAVLTPSRPFAAIHLRSSPTSVASEAFIFFGILLLSRSLRSTEAGRSNGWLRAVVLFALIDLTKPTLPIILLPATLAVEAVRLRGRGTMRREALRVVLIRFVVPVGSLFALQAAVFYAFTSTGRRGSIAFAPFHNLNQVASLDLPLVFSAWAFPLSCLLLLDRKWSAEPLFGVAWLTFALSLLPAFLLTEVGPRSSDANFTLAAYASLGVITVVSLRSLGHEISAWWAQRPLHRRRSPGWRLLVPCCLLVVSAAAGLPALLNSWGIT